jgi:hypothetical protein
MIHRDLCDPFNTKNYSALRIQFHFLLSRFVCWNGFIPLTSKEIAELLNCDIQSIHKFIKKGIKDEILRLEGDRLQLIKYVPSKDYKMGYIRHFSFVESSEFRQLSLHTQRFILYTLWYGVHNGRPLWTKVSAMYHATAERTGKLNLYQRKHVYKVVEEAKPFLKVEIVESKGHEYVSVKGLQETYAKQPELKNEGEAKLLDDILVAHDCHEFVCAASRIDMLKLKREYVNKLKSVGVELFSHGLEKILLSFNLYELDQRGEVGQYLRKILKDLEEKIVPTIQKRMGYVKTSLESISALVVKQASKWKDHFEHVVDELSEALQTILTPNPAALTGDDVISFQPYNWLENI